MQDKLQILRNQLIQKAKKQVQIKYAESDVHIIRAVSLLQDLDASFNLLAENCIEWYGAHFPELQQQLRNNELCLQLISSLGERKNYGEKKVAEIVKEKEKAAVIAVAAGKSMGSDVKPDVLSALKQLAENSLNLKKERAALEKMIEKEMNAYAPNTALLAGPVLAARLLAAAGGLRQLALMPASTIQLLGAEKALFLHLRNPKIKGPKYGFLYQHALVRSVQPKHKGKVARSVAAKLAIAARLDFFGSKEKIAEKMLLELKEKIKKLH
ncbi:MAG: NOP5/NOP56 family protein [Candidatus Diapherotrites archaeon]|nr:NOP5/NOP56 family protein [Candidatus Diapherotrites archaeon]